MDLGLEGKTALVTGASRGIGRGIALALAAEGCDVGICARSENDLEEVAREIESKGVDAHATTSDLTRETAPQTFVEGALDAFGRIDIVVNNVGGNRRKRFGETSEEDWEQILNLNFLSAVRTCRSALPSLKRSGGGNIVFISSIWGREKGRVGYALYNSTKSAMISLAGIMAMELAEQGIRVNTVAPGSVRFPGGSWDRRCKEDPEAMEEFVDRNLPMGRFGTVEEVADVVTFLVSERASLVNGACVTVDGGQSHSLI